MTNVKSPDEIRAHYFENMPIGVLELLREIVRDERLNSEEQDDFFLFLAALAANNLENYHPNPNFERWQILNHILNSLLEDKYKKDWSFIWTGEDDPTGSAKGKGRE